MITKVYNVHSSSVYSSIGGEQVVYVYGLGEKELLEIRLTYDPGAINPRHLRASSQPPPGVRELCPVVEFQDVSRADIIDEHNGYVYLEIYQTYDLPNTIHMYPVGVDGTE